MEQVMSELRLERENQVFLGTGGRSQENRGVGFLPAFFDLQTEIVYLSCFADGRPAPFHLLDGLPEEVVLMRHDSGRVAQVKASVISGFVREGRFYTREAAAAAVSQLN
jgi:hypothetical protein